MNESNSHGPKDRARRGEYVAVLLAAGVLYAVTAGPDILWQDSGLVTIRAVRADLKGWLGLALSHPVYYLLVQPVVRCGLGEPAARVNLFSGLWAAVAVANVYMLIGSVTRDRRAAGLGAAVLAVAHTFWWHATAAEVYSLSLAGLTGELLVLMRYLQTRQARWAVVLGVLNGAGVANHLMAAMALPAYGIILGRDALHRAGGRRNLAWALGGWLAGASPLLILAAVEVVGGESLQQVMVSLLFGRAGRYRQAVLAWPPLHVLVVKTVQYVGLSFPTPLALLGFVGVWSVRRMSVQPAWRATLWWLSAAYLLFAARYRVPDQFVFFLWFEVLFALWIGFGAERFLRRYSRWGLWAAAVGAIMPVAVYALVVPLARGMSIDLGVQRQLPYRDPYAYFLRPWRTGYHGPRRFALEAFQAVGPGGVILCDTTTAPVFAYLQQVNGVGLEVRCQLERPSAYFPQVTVTAASIGDVLQRGVVVATCSRQPQYVPDWLYAVGRDGRIRWRYRLERCRPVFRVMPLEVRP